MELAEAKLIKSGNNIAVSYGDDNQNYVEFEMGAVPDQVKSLEMGCPQYLEKPFIKIMFPGDKTKIINRPVKEEDKRKYPRQWASFQAQETQVVSGFPIDKWPPLNKAEALNMRAMGIHTVEALAGLPDVSLTWFGATKYREMAISYLAQAKDGAGALKMAEENAALKADVESLKEQVKQLAAMKSPETLTLNKKETK